MSRLTPAARLALALLVPAYLAAFYLHVAEVERSGLALLPVFAVPGGEDGYPLVGGLRLERGVDWNDLRVGDRMLRVGERDLAGAGYLSFDVIAFEQAGDALSAPLVFEREGVRRTTELRLISSERPWYRLPFFLGFGVTAIAVLLLAPRSQQALRFFVAALPFAILEAPFHSSNPLQTWVYVVAFNFGGAIAVALILRWLIGFPDEMDPRHRLSLRWTWLAALYLVARGSYLLGGPLPSELVPSLVLASDAAFFLLGLGILTWNYVHAAPIGRRRVQWVLWGAWLGLVPMTMAAFLPLWSEGSGLARFAPVFELSAIAAVSIPLGVWIGIVRYNLFDIRRVLSATAVYSLGLITLAGLVAWAAPPLASLAAPRLGVEARSVELVLLVVFAGALVPVLRRLGPRVDAFLFPARRRMALGFGRLRRDLGHCATAPEVLALLESRLLDLLEPTFSIAFAREEERFAPIPGGQGDAAPSVPRDGPAAERLREGREPIVFEEAREDGAPGVLGPLEPALLVPLREGKDLAGFLALGPRRSGDTYQGDAARHVREAADAASAELRRLRDAEILLRERERAALLRERSLEASRANEAKTRFLEAARDELRRPLASLSTAVASLQASVETASERRMADRLARTTGSLSDMFNALLDLSALDAGATAARPRAIELEPWLRQLGDEVGPQAEARGLELHLALETGASAVRSDPVLADRILRNLLSNALRYTQRGHLELRAEDRGDEVVVSVRDTGPGIARERRGEIFDEFVRLDRRAESGLGLGLSIVDRTAKLLGHSLELESELGVGTTFRLVLPRA